MQRTYRYNHKNGTMLPVLEGYKHSNKRPDGKAAKFVHGFPPEQPQQQQQHADHHVDDDRHAAGHQYMRDTDAMDQQQATTHSAHYPAVQHRAAPTNKHSIQPPSF